MRRALLLTLSYLSWNAAFRLIILSVVTYFMARSGAPFAEISETTTKNQILIVGLASVSFLFILILFNPIATVSRSEIVTNHIVEHEFYPAFLRGAVFACVFAAIGIGAGYYRYVGFFVQSDTPAIAVLGLVFRALSILMMVYIDEFIFRGRFMAHIRGAAHPLRAVILGALLYALSKAFQFHIGWAHLVTLGLLGTALSLRAYFNRDFAAGAGMVAGFLIVAHCVFSLPIFGNESQGVVLLRYDIHLDIDAPTVRFLTGGLGGPLSSVVLQTVILVDIIRNFHREQKSLWPLRSAELR